MSDDEEQFNSHSHKSLLQAISNLGKSQHIRKTTRTEAQILQDEFQLVKKSREFSVELNAERSVKKPIIEKKSKNSVGINDIVQVLKRTKKHLDAGKQLKNVQNTKKVLNKPLEKPASDRIKRSIGYEGVKKKLEKWDAIVAKNRAAETQVFPLKTETIYLNTSSNAKPFPTIKSDLRIEMEAAENKLKELKKAAAGDFTDVNALENREKMLLEQKLTRDELLARRRELAYLKMRESQKSAKLRMKNKIKSKKYHKLLKRQKILEEIKQFEILQKTNPEAALEKLNALEKSRVLERASLRHKNTGAWAKNLQVRAKYDKDVRKDLAEQLQISRELTSKKNMETSSEDEEENYELSKIEKNEDPFNPWVKVGNSTNQLHSSTGDEEDNWRKYWLERNKNDELLESYYKEKSNQDDVNVEDETICQNKTDNISEKQSSLVPNCNKLEIKNTKHKEIQSRSNNKNKKNKKIVNGWVEEELTEHPKESRSIDDIFDDKEEDLETKFDNILNGLHKKSEKLKKQGNIKKTKQKHENDALKNLKDLSFTNEKPKIQLDEELIHDDISKTEQQEQVLSKTANSSNIKSDNNQRPVVDVIDPLKVAEVKFKQTHLGSALEVAGDFDMEVDHEENDRLNAQQMTISQAFEDDDIIADFSKEKLKDSELKNVEVELSMPGWGAWAGVGISADKRKSNKRLILKPKQQDKRRDENNQKVYINENVNKHLRTHLVSDVPFPFTSLADYEASIRAPIGRNFVPETAFKMLTRPSVITHKGKIIEPMDESELIKPDRKLRHVVDRRIAKMSANTK